MRTLKPLVPILPASPMLQAKPSHGSAGRRKTGGSAVKDRERIRARDKGLCQACLRSGRITIGDDVDHIVPLSSGGSDDDSNKELLCRSCHLDKTNRDRSHR